MTLTTDTPATSPGRAAAARGFAGDVELLAGQEDVAVQGRQVLPQPVDQHSGALTSRPVDLDARQALQIDGANAAHQRA